MFRSLVVASLFVPVVASADAKWQDKTIVVPPVVSPETMLRDAPFAGLTIYLNQCVGGCTVKPGPDNAQADTSQIVATTTTLPEFTFQGTDWADIVQCVKEVYSPYNVIITDQRPSGPFNMIYVAGHPQDAGQPDGTGGVAIVTQDCSPVPGGVAYAFAYAGATFAAEDDNNFVWGMCWVIAQETAHTLGLDHEYFFTDIMQSACNDPMTYRDDCGGQKFFRNHSASCGEFGPARPGCGSTNSCSTTQNSHQKLLSVVGAGTPITGKPTMSLVVPKANATVMGGTAVIGMGSAQRGIDRVELWINGYKWGSTPGAAFGSAGQPAQAYTVAIPGGVPDSKLDITLKAFDDIGVEGDSPTITVIKGKAAGCDATVMNPDGTVDTCLKGQACTDGKCAWSDAGMGQFGDVCTYPQFCVSGDCEGTDTMQICTHDCDPTIMDSCPMGYECIANGADGICFTPQDSGGGCCSVGDESTGQVAASTGLALLTLGFVFGRRRRNARCAR